MGGRRFDFEGSLLGGQGFFNICEVEFLTFAIFFLWDIDFWGRFWEGGLFVVFSTFRDMFYAFQGETSHIISGGEFSMFTFIVLFSMRGFFFRVEDRFFSPHSFSFCFF